MYYVALVTTFIINNFMYFIINNFMYYVALVTTFIINNFMHYVGFSHHLYNQYLYVLCRF